jgi:hypothetical protein
VEAIIDRFEGDFAVVEMQDLTTVNLPLVLVPGAKEGDVIQIKISGDKTKERKKSIAKLSKKLFID